MRDLAAGFLITLAVMAGALWIYAGMDMLGAFYLVPVVAAVLPLFMRKRNALAGSALFFALTTAALLIQARIADAREENPGSPGEGLAYAWLMWIWIGFAAGAATRLILQSAKGGSACRVRSPLRRRGCSDRATSRIRRSDYHT